MKKNSMKKAIKIILHSKAYPYFLDCLGVFCLSSFLLLWLYLGFIVEITPMCHFSDALIVFVDCGKGLWGGFLHFYFYLFSPLIIGVVMLSILALFRLHLMSLLYITIALIAIVSAFRIVYKLLQILVVERKKFDRKNRVIMACLGFLIILPSLLVSALQYHIAPPAWSDRAMNIDMWHNEFSIPRKHLEKWSLVEIPRPETKTSVTRNFGSYRFRKNAPYFNLKIPFNEITSSANTNEIIELSVRPHPSIWSDKYLFEQREKKFKKRTDKIYHKDKEPIYLTPKKEHDWEVYEARSVVSGRKPDIYVLRNTHGNITHLLECTPKTYCETFNYSKDRWKFSKCKSPEDCMNCTRHCTDSSGTNEYSLYYKFDKKHINEYSDLRTEILQFISSYKKSSKFVLNKEKIVEWTEIDDGISAQLTEVSENELFVLTRNNLDKPLELYIGDILVNSSIVREPFEGGRLIVRFNEEIKEKVQLLLIDK